MVSVALEAIRFQPSAIGGPLDDALPSPDTPNIPWRAKEINHLVKDNCRRGQVKGLEPPLPPGSIISTA
jgi:hypothetical protein